MSIAESSIAPCVSLFDPPQCLHFGWCVPDTNGTYRCRCHAGTTGFNCSVRILLDHGQDAYLQLQYLYGALDLVVVVLLVVLALEGELNLRRGTTW